MEYRHGKCRDCDAEYKVPATFKGDKAKCKKCGGTVAVGPVQKPAAAAAAPVPARKPAPQKPAAPAEHKPSGKRGDGPSMKEKLRAARAETADGAKPAAKPAGARPAGAKATGAKAAGAAQAGAAAAKSASGKQPTARRAGAAAGGVRRGAGAGSRSSARRAGARRGKGASDDDDGDDESPRGSRRPQKKSPLPMIAVGVGVLLVGGAIWQFGFSDSGDEVSAADDETDVADAGEGDALDDSTAGAEDESAEGAASDVEDEPVDDSDPADDAFAELPDLSAAGIRRYKAPSNRQITTPKKLNVSIPEQLSDTLQNQIAQANSAMQIKVVKRKADYIIESGKIIGSDGVEMDVPENRVKEKLEELYWARDIADEHYVLDDPAEPKLSEFEKFGPPEGVSGDEWDALQEAVTLMLDVDSGAAGGRAQRKLEETGRDALPAIINSLLELNLETEGGYLMGGVAYKALRKICNNQGFNWDYRFEESPTKCTLENRRTVEKYYQVWEKILASPEYWWQFSKLDKDEAEEDAIDDAAIDVEAELDELDELDDLDDLDD